MNLAWLKMPSPLWVGHSRRSDRLPVSSGLPQSTDIAIPLRLVRFVPTRDSAASNGYGPEDPTNINGIAGSTGVALPPGAICQAAEVPCFF
jgi:hypothetical protein